VSRAGVGREEVERASSVVKGRSSKSRPRRRRRRLGTS